MTKTERAIFWVSTIGTGAWLLWWWLHRNDALTTIGAPAPVSTDETGPPGAYNLNFETPDMEPWKTATGYVPLFGFIQLSGRYGQ